MLRKVIVAAAFAAAALAAAGAQAGDAANGEKVFGKCKACHSFEKNGVGPNLAGVVGRNAGAVDGFKYSDAMKAAGPWTAENLDKYLADPKGFIPGNKMVFAGLKDAKERADVIAFLQSK